MSRGRTPVMDDGEVALDTRSAVVRRPRHRVVFETLLNDIASGRFQPGDRLPTEAELAKTFSASRSTIARAMRDLKSRGLLNRQRGGGTHIARTGRKQLALFAPFARGAASLGYIGGQIYNHLSELASTHLDHLRLQLVPRTERLELDHMLAAAKALIDQGVQGVFYYPEELPPENVHFNHVVAERLMSAGMAVVCVDRDIVTFPDRSHLPLITYDNRRAGYLVTQHVISRGCKRIAFIGTPMVSSAAADRLRGYHDAMNDAGLPNGPDMVRLATTIDNLDLDYVRRMIDEVKPEAIVCKHDHYAAIVGRHLLSMGMTIGKDIMITGFDDEPFAELLPVPLTTIRFPADPFAQVCFERMNQQLEQPNVPLPGATILDVELVIRPSTGG